MPNSNAGAAELPAPILFSFAREFTGAPLPTRSQYSAAGASRWARRRHHPTMPPGVLTLRDYPGDQVRVVCELCGRSGAYSRARLVQRHGADMGLPALLATISADCPRRQDWRHAGPCQAGFPDLVGKPQVPHG